MRVPSSEARVAEELRDGLLPDLLASSMLLTKLQDREESEEDSSEVLIIETVSATLTADVDRVRGLLDELTGKASAEAIAPPPPVPSARFEGRRGFLHQYAFLAVLVAAIIASVAIVLFAGGNGNARVNDPAAVQASEAGDPSAPPVASIQSGPDHPLAALATGTEVAVFAQDAEGQLWLRETRGGTFGAWSVLGQGATSGPRAVRRGDEQFVFFKDLRGAVTYHQRSVAGAWSSAVELDGAVVTAPVAAADADGDLLVAAIGRAMETPVYRRLQGSIWSEWTPLDGVAADTLELVAHAGDLYLLGWRQGGGELWSRKWSASRDQWESTVRHGSTAVSGVAAASLKAELHLFGLDRDGATLHRVLSGNGWSECQSLGGQLEGRLQAVSTGSSMAVGGLSLGRRLWVHEIGPLGPTGDWRALGGDVLSGLEIEAAGPLVYAFALDSAGVLWYRRSEAGVWSAWQTAGGKFR